MDDRLYMYTDAMMLACARVSYCAHEVVARSEDPGDYPIEHFDDLPQAEKDEWLGFIADQLSGAEPCWCDRIVFVVAHELGWPGR